MKNVKCITKPKPQNPKEEEIMDTTSSPSQVDRISQMREVQQEALTLFTKKNADYGDAFAKYGVIGVLLRIEDKIQRSISISRSGINMVDDERLYDTMLDLHNYAAMALMLMKESDKSE